MRNHKIKIKNVYLKIFRLLKHERALYICGDRGLDHVWHPSGSPAPFFRVPRLLGGAHLEMCDKLATSKQVLKVTLKDQFNSNGLPKIPSWLAHILPARNPNEQTLEIIVKGAALLSNPSRALPGEELRAWFGQDLADILKLPVIPPNVMEGKKRFECMLCQEQFENPFPVVAHLMYRCRRKDQGMSNLRNPFRKQNGGRVKNFDIATLTDMNDSDNRSEPPRSPQSPTSSVTSDTAKVTDANGDSLSEANGKGRKELKISTSTLRPQKVQDILRKSEHSPAIDGHMTSAFAPNTKLPTTVSNASGTIHQQLKMAEEFKGMRKMSSLAESGGYELTLMSPTLNDVYACPLCHQLSSMHPNPNPLDVFSGSKGLPPPLIPFLPPSLAALSFPSQNWCAKCNASFRMTSDLVYPHALSPQETN
ncbi:PR domain zinc finger protein 8 [Caerostris extrusa]|uniref:PR domain zinc finger protein 8 n=1 Tax=Caerostris extrusa TaxID=172846 RepID=A0AAV4PF15_CAEEX|nr:PR domain zinc finger protein 8 [Caerostris extrusa]